MQSAVLIVPDAHRDAANAFGAAMGWGEGNYSVALSVSGKAPATHWGCRADVPDSFVAMLDNPPADAAPILAVVQIDLREGGDAYWHFMEVIAASGLQMVQGDD